MIWEWSLAQRVRRGCESPSEMTLADGGGPTIGGCSGDWPFNGVLLGNESLRSNFVGERSLNACC